MMNRLAALGFLFVAGSLHAEVKVLTNFTLIDGSGRAPAASSALIIDNGRVTWLGPAAKLKVPAGAQPVDLDGKYVIPGIINLHGHVGNVVDLKQDAKFFTAENVERNLKAYASYGVTAVMSMGTEQDLIFGIRDQQRAGRPKEARIFTAGQGLVFKGGYGGLAGLTPEVSTAEDVERVVAAQAAKKVDLIKFWMDDHFGTQKRMPAEIGKAIIESGHRHHLKVAAHIFYLEDAKNLVSYGVDGLAHSVRDKPVDQALIDGMKKNGTWQLAGTLAREAGMFVYAGNPKFLNDPFFVRGVSTSALQTLKSPQYQNSIKADPEFEKYPGILDLAMQNLKKLSDSGVKIGFGTDSGPPGRIPGYAEHWEMELMVKAGLTPAQVIQCATRRAAEFLGARDLGAVEKGKWADLVVLDADPLQDIRNTRKISAVYIAGNRVE
jgi:imidazolonepropionase-like amidohydrolase